MDEQDKTKCKQWTIRLTFEEPQISSWDAPWLTQQILQMIEDNGPLKAARCTRVEAENCGY